MSGHHSPSQAASNPYQRTEPVNSHRLSPTNLEPPPKSQQSLASKVEIDFDIEEDSVKMRSNASSEDGIMADTEREIPGILKSDPTGSVSAEQLPDPFGQPRDNPNIQLHQNALFATAD